MSSLPTWESVSAEPGIGKKTLKTMSKKYLRILPCVDNAQVGHEAGFGQVQVVLPQLTRVKLAFVDYGLGRQGTDVEPGVLIGDGVGGNLIIKNIK